MMNARHSGKYLFSGNGGRKWAREDLRFSVVTEIVPLRQMPDTVNALSRLKIVSRVIAVISHLHHAIMLDPVEALFHFSLLVDLMKLYVSAELVGVEILKSHLRK
jgi:hypothetical protein